MEKMINLDQYLKSIMKKE